MMHSADEIVTNSVLCLAQQQPPGGPGGRGVMAGRGPPPGGPFMGAGRGPVRTIPSYIDWKGLIPLITTVSGSLEVQEMDTSTEL